MDDSPHWSQVVGTILTSAFPLVNMILGGVGGVNMGGMSMPQMAPPPPPPPPSQFTIEKIMPIAIIVGLFLLVKKMM